ncbi:late competence development ComFB family protein|uniref:Competence protein ComFB n=1 Tax=Dendrosporobacter quercicolus TaxID=146817 RepID=A0A1G9LEZ4_9FIRM|nr:late competence development ComFB family protein [Dendrosporobacter quercicolus]NSL46690.1 late competence development ComFB family protein [Dendrosporobacter quercicolus DSM 1736]SDL60446.1 competence protein ComFB [Dendrosporobacter quercicolus]
MQLKNFMEELVLQQLDGMIAKQESVCGCSRCRLDIAALALNYLSPRYIVTAEGETYTRIQALEQQFAVDVISALVKAITIVQARPRHGAE